MLNKKEEGYNTPSKNTTVHDLQLRNALMKVSSRVIWNISSGTKKWSFNVAWKLFWVNEPSRSYRCVKYCSLRRSNPWTDGRNNCGCQCIINNFWSNSSNSAIKMYFSSYTHINYVKGNKCKYVRQKSRWKRKTLEVHKRIKLRSCKLQCKLY